MRFFYCRKRTGSKTRHKTQNTRPPKGFHHTPSKSREIPQNPLWNRKAHSYCPSILKNHNARIELHPSIHLATLQDYLLFPLAGNTLSPRFGPPCRSRRSSHLRSPLPSGTVLGSIGGRLLPERPAGPPVRSFGGSGLSVHMHIVITLRIARGHWRENTWA